MTASKRPLLLLDVDGPLNPWGALTKQSFIPPKVRKHAGEEPYEFVRHQIDISESESYPVLVSEGMGADLWSLDYRAGGPMELIWATTWTDNANRLLSPLLGFSEPLEVIRWPSQAEIRARYDHFPRLGSWKTPYIADWLAMNRSMTPWLWLDDDIYKSDRQYFRRWYGEGLGPAHKLVQVPPHLGIRRLDMVEIRAWAEEHSPEKTKEN